MRFFEAHRRGLDQAAAIDVLQPKLLNVFKTETAYLTPQTSHQLDSASASSKSMKSLTSLSFDGLH
jgi:hypothetical protein